MVVKGREKVIADILNKPLSHTTHILSKLQKPQQQQQCEQKVANNFKCFSLSPSHKIKIKI